MPTLGFPQEGKVEIGADSRAREIARREQVARQKLRDEIRASHPSLTDAQINELIDKAQREWLGGSTGVYGKRKNEGRLFEKSHALDLGVPSRDELREEVRQAGATLLKPADARGWVYVGYTRRNLRGPASEEVRFSPDKDNPARVEKFLLVDSEGKLFPFFAEASDFTHQNTIKIPRGEDLRGEDLTRFYQVNNRFLRDVPKAPSPPVTGLSRFPGIEDANAMVITGARLANGKEVLTIFSLADLARTGAVHGEVYIDSYTVRAVDLASSLREVVELSESVRQSGVSTETILRKKLSGM